MKKIIEEINTKKKGYFKIFNKKLRLWMEKYE